MSLINKVKSSLSKSLLSLGDKIAWLSSRGELNWMDDETYLKYIWRLRMGYPLDLANPQTFNEKLQWLKINDRNPLYTTLVDKYESKKWAAPIIGEEHIIPSYGVWDHFDDIDFDKLPEKFVLKTTHDNAGVAVIDDRDTFDRKKVKKLLEKHLHNKFYMRWRELFYKDVKPRIMAEKYLETDNKLPPFDYKFFCFNGKCPFFKTNIRAPEYQNRDLSLFDGSPAFKRIDTKKHQYLGTFYDLDCNLIPMNKLPEVAFKDTVIVPEHLNIMLEIAEKLSQGIPHVRVDFYENKGQVYLGELTLCNDAGYYDFAPEKYNKIIGDMIDLSIVKK